MHGDLWQAAPSGTHPGGETAKLVIDALDTWISSTASRGGWRP